MKKPALPFFVFVILAISVSLGLSNAYAIGHYGIPGTYLGGCDVCHDFINGGYAPASGNLRWVRSTINWDGNEYLGVTYTQTFDDTPPFDGTMADGNDTDLDGPCEVCHTNTNYHIGVFPGDQTTHFDGQYCTACHPHFADDIINYFEPRFIGTQSHTTHWTDPKGPEMGEDTCTECHLSSNYSLFADGQPLESTGVCDDCHSQGGAFDGVALAKAKWEDAVYESNGTDLKPGNENWCASCHDAGTSTVAGVDAPDVMGNNVTWGYNHSGHGKYAVACQHCHDLAVTHTDGEARTYSASAAPNNYRSGYRLNEDMAVPRDGETHPVAFRLCTNCHVYTDITGTASRFRDDGTGMQYHEMHLNWWPAFTCSDSDFDGVGCSTGACSDSAITCINCHNVHGPPNPAMIRHGELMSTPGTSDKVPALDFHWYKADGVTQTTVLGESRYGGLICGLIPDISVNYTCSGCHGTGELKWYRNPVGPQGITLEAVWTTDLSDVTKTTFYPTESIRYHARFTLIGTSGPYFVKVAKSGAGNTSSMPGTDWITRLFKQGTIGSGTYHITWDKTIPGEAEPGSPAKLLIRIFAYDAGGSILLDQDEQTWNFSIVAGP